MSPFWFAGIALIVCSIYARNRALSLLSGLVAVVSLMVALVTH